MVDIVKEIDKALGKLSLGMAACGMLGGCMTYFTLNILPKHKWMHLPRGSYTIAMFAILSCIVGGRCYLSYMMNPTERFLVELGLDSRYYNARAATLAKYAKLPKD